MGLRQWGLTARILFILVLVLVLDFTANAWLNERSNRFSMPHDEAAALAQNLIAAESRIDRATPADRAALTRRLSSATLRFDWSAGNQAPVPGIDLGNLEDQLLRLQPALARARLEMTISPLRLTDGLTGTMTLGDRTTLRFAGDTRSAWPLVLGHLADFLLPTTAFALLAWLLTYGALRPLRKLVRASLRVGTRRAQPIAVAGPGEVQLLIRAFNSMQQRIDALLDSNSQTILAIAHDLRTPLTRMQLRLDAMGIDDDDRQGLESDMGEIRDLLASLQSYIDLDGDAALREPVDLAAMAQTLVDQSSETGGVASYHGPDHLVVHARPLALRRSIGNLLDNAVHYGGSARVILVGPPSGVTIMVEDDGPGIPPDAFDKVLQPFIRLDHARERNTSGMGLGLAIVDRAVRAEGGALILANRPTGGLRATIRLPESALLPAPATLPYN
ncbi:ATP-binding protein [Novosphingobium sp.]|uniref:ATP-binding protein n=1 Tax=Novosphingobium sp. TaxID=1874826 RepID=UPI00333F0FC3